jgi:chemotaxis protein CheD
MNSELAVNSGEVNACKGEGILRARALGSCVAVTAYSPDCRVGAMAHVMLPGTQIAEGSPHDLKYAEDAIQEMMRLLTSLGVGKSGIHVCLVGGGNVLGADHESPGEDTVQSVTEVLAMTGITPVATEVGGTQRRSCALDLGCGRVTYTVGDSAEMVLWGE